MKRPRPAPSPAPDRDAAPSRVFLATDLAAEGAGPTSWRALKVAVAERDGGPTTPSGHRFAESGAGSLRLEVVPPLGPPIAAPSRPDERPLPPVTLRPARGLPGLSLAIGRDRAVVAMAPEHWDRAAPAIMLAVSLAWRFLEVDRQLDDLAARASDRRGVADRLRAIRRLGLDLSCSEGPLVDPRGFLPSREAFSLFRALARPLGLLRWRDRLDERFEAIEGAIESLADERRHAQVLVFEVGLELLILAALALDIGLNLYFSLNAGE